MFLLNERAVCERTLQHATRNWLAEIDKPRHRRARMLPGSLGLFTTRPGAGACSLPPAKIEDAVSMSSLASWLLPKFSGLDSSLRREEARQHALIVALALRLHQLETGHLPDKLEELVDAEILESVPIDPWHPTGKPLRYHRKDNTAVVYSLGENGVDDGGEFEAVGAGPPDIGFAIEPVKTHNEP